MKRVAIIAALLLTACGEKVVSMGAGGGDPARGRQLVASHYACTACHSIPTIDGARGMAGPPLDHLASRPAIAGRLKNTPENMVRWLQDPQAVVPAAAMPNMDIDRRDARDIAAFLATLK